MSKVPRCSYIEVLRALQRDGWVVVRQKGSHIKRSTLSHILKQARLSVEQFNKSASPTAEDIHDERDVNSIPHHS